MATWKSTYGNPDWYKKQIPADTAQRQADQLGISTDQLFQLYVASNTTPGPLGAPLKAPPTQSQGGFQGWSGGQGWTSGGQDGTLVNSPGALINAPPGGSAIISRYGPSAAWNKIVGSGAQQTPPPAPTTGIPWTTGTIMNPVQLKPTTPLPIQPTQPPVPIQPGQPFAQIPQPPAQPLPQQQPLSAQNVLNPIPVQLQPVQQYGSGGLVQRFQGGGPVQQLQPGVTRNAQGQVIYTDPALQTQFGLGNLTTAQQTALGLDPYHAQALSGAQQVGTLYQPQFLGGAALDTGAVINLPPSGTPSSKSGVAPTPGAVVGTAVPQTPQGPWLTNPSVFAKASMPVATGAQMPQGGLPFGQGKGIVQFTGDQIAANKDPTLYRVDLGTGLTQALSGGQVLRTTNEAANPTWFKTVQDAMRLGVAQPVPMMAGTPPATSAPYTPGQAFATPPAAPAPLAGTLPPTMAQSGATEARPPSAMLPPGFVGGAQGAGYVPQAFLQDHTSALANAGMALYAHFGGDPKSASHADIANFQNQLTAGVKKMASGGLVPGRGNEDTVPALLTPGEYVIPKQQVAQLVAGGALKMQSGGLVQDPDPDPEPPEARRQALTVQSGNAPSGSQPSGQPSSSSAQRSSLQVPEGSSLTSGLAQAAQTYRNSLYSGGARSLYSGGASGGGYNVPGGYIGARPGPGQSGYMYPSQAAATAAGDVGTGVKGGGGLGSPAAQSALGGVASGLNQAAQAIASSVGPWQVQQSAIPDPSQLPKYQIPTLQPVRVT